MPFDQRILYDKMLSKSCANTIVHMAPLLIKTVDNTPNNHMLDIAVKSGQIDLSLADRGEQFYCPKCQKFNDIFRPIQCK